MGQSTHVAPALAIFHASVPITIFAALLVRARDYAFNGGLKIAISGRPTKRMFLKTYKTNVKKKVFLTAKIKSTSPMARNGKIEPRAFAQVQRALSVSVLPLEISRNGL